MNNENSFNICSSRIALHTIDVVPPGHFQVVQVLSQVTDSGYSWSSKLRYSANAKAEEHNPPILTPGIHSPYPFITYSD